MPPLGPGLYNFTANGTSNILGSPPALADYTFALTLAATQAVPEPGTLALAGLALAGLAARHKSSRRKGALPRR